MSEVDESARLHCTLVADFSPRYFESNYSLGPTDYRKKFITRAGAGLHRFNSILTFS